MKPSGVLKDIFKPYFLTLSIKNVKRIISDKMEIVVPHYEMGWVFAK